ncbi:glycogen operon protein [Mameliella alba]|uniref:glycogen debranching protein GlgX n=1 Tax=Mameliella alba TaxID=561184 RepID=UPI0008833398|nr:glycogen debranching protein GlgX [Mameliella alba]OWV47870.1 glycogen debranching enzyme GlgX [Mameliella alba]PTR39739.1 glycogen operon protein [Mameliella alba]GGF61960.1 glycogen operon protein GlgX homolog [Mameliella alba]SDD13868.1 glycogen operon protein [Mameliella alba]
MTEPGGGTYGIGAGRPNRLGAVFDGEGTNFALFSDHAQRVDLCLFSPDGKTEQQRLSLPERRGAVWHGYVPGLKPGALYGYRVHGPFAPERGHRFNANKLLVDPYTRALHGGFSTHPATFGYSPGSADGDLSFSSSDSAAHTPKSVVWDPADYPTGTRGLRRGWSNTVIYETHVRGSTMRHPDVPEALRGTVEGLASDAMLDHLTRLGITTVELLPVQAIRSENALTGRGLVNYWGYNTAGFFVPEPRYLGPAGVAGFRRMVDRFHAAGIEVILDVVYNHSAEGDHLGPTFSFRGLDNASYYRLVEGQPRFYVNDTGTGNTLNTDHPFVLRMILDSLRFWVDCMGVDGFRFDLATTLGRERQGFDRHGGFMDALRQDPLLAEVKLIAEPWDLGHGGYRLGQFPPEFAEWNDRFRDTVRRFWRGDGHAAQDLGSALLGTADLFDTRGRRAWASVNFAAAHDGFTLADVTAYSKRHNQANGEGNRDGHHANHSDNLGEEGETKDATILSARRQRVRNMLATVLLSQGTPMILAGDEGGHSQGGNNNAYCQDNETSWLDWATMDKDLVDFTAALIAFRKAHGVLRQGRFLHGVQRADGKPDVEWRGFDGSALNWRDPGLSSLCLLLRGCAESPSGCADTEEILLAFNREGSDQVLELPPPAGTWRREIDSSAPRQHPQDITEATVTVAAFSVAGFVRHPEKTT